MQRTLDDKERVMEAFLQNPTELRNYGFLTQGNINAYAQYAKPEPQVMSKEAGVKAYSQTDMKSSVSLGLLSQISRPSEVTAQNLIQPGNLNLIRPNPDEVVQQAQNLALFESALRMRLGEQAFVQQQQQHFQQQQQENRMKQGQVEAVPQHSVAAVFRRNMTSPMTPCSLPQELHARSNNQSQSLAAYAQPEVHLAASPPQHRHSEYVSVLPPRSADVTRSSHSTHIPSQSTPSHARGVHTPVAVESPPRNFPPESVAAFMHAMRNLTSTEVGKAVIPPDTLTEIMQTMEEKAEELLTQNPDYVKIKSEFGPTGDQFICQKDLDPEQYLSDAKLKNDLNMQHLLALNPDFRMKAMDTQEPMPLVVQPQSDSGPLRSPDIVFPGCSPMPQLPGEQGLFSVPVATKPKKPKERPHICLVCHMAFSQKNHLQVHERKHTGEKPYRCLICEAAFARKDGLVIHQRKHTGERPYKCTFCDSAFTRKDKMVIHERTHTGEKPYQCHQCESKYTRKDKLTLHLKKHALAARKELEKAIQSTSAVVTSLALQSNAANAANLTLTETSLEHLQHSTSAANCSADDAANISFCLPSTVASSLGLHNTIAANFGLPNAVASNVLGNLTLQNVAVNLNAVATALGNNVNLTEASAANLRLQDSVVANLSMHDSGATNLSTSSMST